MQVSQRLKQQIAELPAAASQAPLAVAAAAELPANRRTAITVLAVRFLFASVVAAACASVRA